VSEAGTTFTPRLPLLLRPGRVQITINYNIDLLAVKRARFGRERRGAACKEPGARPNVRDRARRV